ncbi:Orexin receptor type 2 [Holothuria leucospilota]|uniref:Orexin receptor type 2 n=1 Tax=Holothuria leucospilota TaxID=206669 RepID=A0A9Q0YHD8_HOLLE|nr:Orexin receptor type 2 [Holothuria leucospilota]
MEIYQWLMIFYFAILFLVGSIANILLLAIYWKNKNHSSVIVFIKALAITDFYVCFTKPVGIFYWLLQDYSLDNSFCKVFQFTIGTGYTLTFCMIFLVALDRYLAIYHTEGSFSVTAQHAMILVAAAWLLCHVGNIIKIMLSDDLQLQFGKYFCAERADGSVYVMYGFLAFVFVLCSMVVLWLNFQIIQALKRQSQTKPEGSIPRINQKMQGLSRAEVFKGTSEEQQQAKLVDLESHDSPKKGKSEKMPSKQLTRTTTSKTGHHQKEGKPVKAKKSKVITSLTKMLAVVTLLYVATSLPSIIIYFVPLDSEFWIAQQSPILYALYLLLKYLFFVDSIVKPFIYYAISRTFREQCRDFFKQLRL